jgi:hypothetical protein
MSARINLNWAANAGGSTWYTGVRIPARRKSRISRRYRCGPKLVKCDIGLRYGEDESKMVANAGGSTLSTRGVRLAGSAQAVNSRQSCCGHLRRGRDECRGNYILNRRSLSATLRQRRERCSSAVERRMCCLNFVVADELWLGGRIPPPAARLFKQSGGCAEYGLSPAIYIRAFRLRR